MRVLCVIVALLASAYPELSTTISAARSAAPRGDPELFEQRPFLLPSSGRFARFDYRGWHRELVRDRITHEDVSWAMTWLSALSDRQWRDAFRAGDYPAAEAERFIRKLRQGVAEGLAAEGISPAREAGRTR